MYKFGDLCESYRGCAEYLLKASEKDIAEKDKAYIDFLINGRELLSNCCRKHNYDAVKFLLELGVDVNETNGVENTPYRD